MIVFPAGSTPRKFLSRWLAVVKGFTPNRDATHPYEACCRRVLSVCGLRNKQDAERGACREWNSRE
jgi:hypothetical protein